MAQQHKYIHITIWYACYTVGIPGIMRGPQDLVCHTEGPQDNQGEIDNDFYILAIDVRPRKLLRS